MLGITREVRESRFYRDVKEEGKEEAFMTTVPMLIQGGFSTEEIADRLKLTIEQVRQFAQAQS